jgi:hypothetical protein
MVDDLGLLGGAKGAYCVAKCGIEALDRKRRGVDGDSDTESRRYAMCLADCITPVDLPNIGGETAEDEDSETASADSANIEGDDEASTAED